jgi:hypothetical protein
MRSENKNPLQAPGNNKGTVCAGKNIKAPDAPE